MKKDKILIDGKKFDSRLIMGTSLYPNIDVLNKSIEISECEIVTISMRRFNSTKKNFFFDQLLKKKNNFSTQYSWLFYKKRGNFNSWIS